MSARLSLHLARLEAEAITIMHEVVAEFRAPVLLYSIGKDSNVLLHVARKAFYPGRLPFSVLHIDTTWKFRDMIAFRDRMAKKLGLQLIVHINEEGLALGINPFTSDSALYTQVMKTEGLKQALESHAFDVAIGGARRDEEKIANDSTLGRAARRPHRCLLAAISILAMIVKELSRIEGAARSADPLSGLADWVC
jgi:sulfate adenylyltransferase subunit 2